MKRLIFSAFIFLVSVCAIAQTSTKSDLKFKFYGRIRADLFYNSRANNETVDGLFYMFPLDHKYDDNGKDLNGNAQGNMYMLYTRLGVNISGPNVGSAKTTANVEVDFRGGGSTYSVIRLRHAYVNLDWGKSSVLVGQTWHPMFGEVSPSILNLSTGAPFQPFNRSPMIRYRYSDTTSGLQLTTAAIWQMQYTSAGPDGKTHNYLKNSCIPEIFAGVDYIGEKFRIGVGGELLSLKPRQQVSLDGKSYCVNERVTSLSAEAHAKYTSANWVVSAKTALANNLTQCSMIGGFGVISEDKNTLKREYTPFRHSASWLNIVYGKKWQPGVFLGYLKNLGTGKAITGPTYGTGLDIDQLFSSNWQLSYNLPNWKLGVEFETSTAWYGQMDKSDGKVTDTHAVTNYRVLGVMMFIF